MKETVTDASESSLTCIMPLPWSNYRSDFPRTAQGRTYHLGVRTGEVANRIVRYFPALPSLSLRCVILTKITVGSPCRARSIATLLSAHPPPFVLESDRGFLTTTGLYEGVPVSIVSVGMGSANMDFFVREARECITGDMVIVR